MKVAYQAVPPRHLALALPFAVLVLDAWSFSAAAAAEGGRRGLLRGSFIASAWKKQFQFGNDDPLYSPVLHCPHENIKASGASIAPQAMRDLQNSKRKEVRKTPELAPSQSRLLCVKLDSLSNPAASVSRIVTWVCSWQLGVKVNEDDYWKAGNTPVRPMDIHCDDLWTHKSTTTRGCVKLGIYV